VAKPERVLLIAGDMRQAIRFVWKNPAFAAISIVTLAFGIGVNGAIFTMVDALALRGLPYERPERLAVIETHRPSASEIEPWTSAPDFFDLRERNQTFSEIAGISPIF
jgi:hypothetical protein